MSEFTSVPSTRNSTRNYRAARISGGRRQRHGRAGRERLARGRAGHATPWGVFVLPIVNATAVLTVLNAGLTIVDRGRRDRVADRWRDPWR